MSMAGVASDFPCSVSELLLGVGLLLLSIAFIVHVWWWHR